MADIIELSANPHELGRTLFLGKREFKLRRGRKKELIFDRRSLIDLIPIIESLFECWIFGSVLKSNWVPCGHCAAERNIIKKLYASV
ncbi:hypothetical protein AVEN_89597-1 [Araneus ventricosus]|uniref:Uncharacterized protein n=1 Tax=Araneus ventricosus TaxID=182803 RepID=A0A4Y2JVY6_ARAVE|nr:hypothetical protein AVEN_89597-1 [Araneus ventricosus]